jgi:charged multivesicular body protein 6
MLGGKISNQDEDEVEEELEALARQLRNAEQEELPVLPGVPSKELPAHEAAEPESEPQPARQAMLA